MKILVTGAAGFIGFHLCQKLLQRGDTVVGLDNLNPYYDVSLKTARLAQLNPFQSFKFHHVDLIDREQIESIFSENGFDAVVHLAAQAGVRYSIKNPHAYLDSNLHGFLNILEGCRRINTGHFVFASSSSVYGANKKIPFAVEDNVDYPVSLYAATKKANELMAHSYSHLYKVPTTGLRFFTVYGPWGRPDMAIFLFTKAILEGKPIKVFNAGKMKRDFTYIDDVVEGLIRVISKVPQPNLDSESLTTAPYKTYNIGNNKPVELLRMIEILEDCIGKEVVKEMLPMQPGDVPITYANVDALIQDVGFSPDTPLEVGIKQFVEWYRSYYNC
ncbi:MAG: NAD-dependent epimerase [Cyanobacteriota bacterium]|nr:NAD-dependent epimerase [Cyanobacteriota bacterium]